MKNEWNANKNEMKLICVIGKPTKKAEIKYSSASSRINCWKVYESENGRRVRKNTKLMNNSLKYVLYKFHWITDIWISFQSCRD